MKVVIFAGGYGTRLREETGIVPKPLVEIGGMPILWHIMKIYEAHGLTDFVVCCGYKGHMIKEYFLNYINRGSDITIDLSTNDVTTHRMVGEPWRVTLADTGLETMTGGRLKRVRDYIGNETFCLTYGDGVSDVDIGALLKFHKEQGALATVTAVHQPGRFGALDLSPDQTRIAGFREKNEADGHLINGGFFVCEPSVIDYVEGDDTVWEKEPLTALVGAKELAIYRHDGFWQNMDTLRDRHVLEDMWASGKAKWKAWS